MGFEETDFRMDFEETARRLSPAVERTIVTLKEGGMRDRDVAERITRAVEFLILHTDLIDLED